MTAVPAPEVVYPSAAGSPRTLADPEDHQDLFVPVYCSGCRKRIGLATGNPSVRTRVYCTWLCYREGDATPEQARNDVWWSLYTRGRAVSRIAALYGSTTPPVYRVLDTFSKAFPWRAPAKKAYQRRLRKRAN